MKKIIIGIFISLSIYVSGQQKPLMVVNGEEVSAQEFLAVFMKNNLQKKIIREELEEYLDLYLNYRLKIAEARRLKLDTIEALRKEFEGYRRTLAQPYLTKTEILDKLTQQAWERLQWDLRVSHILVKVSPYASPSDTLRAYRRALAIRQEVLKGQSFEKVAYEKSDDEFARGSQGDKPVQGNYGDLGYFSALDMIYQFENAAYSLKVGEISMPIRTEYGYHIIKLTDKKPALGKVQVAHILLTLKADASEQEKQDIYNKTMDIYNRIMSGESFETLASQFSDDKGSGRRGGVLPWFGPFRMLPQFIEPLYDMKPGDISKPILTIYGYHIVKLIDRKPHGSFNEIKVELKTRIMRDARYRQAIEAFVKEKKGQRNFLENPVALNELIKAIPSEINESNWKSEDLKHMTKSIFSIAGKTYTQFDFAKYLENQGIKNIQKTDNKEVFIREKYKNYINDMIIAYENDNLEYTHPEFGALMKEYFDGILIFELTDRMVWKKAMQDTVGLKSFYEQIKHKYLNPEKVEGVLLFYTSEKDAIKVYKKLAKAKQLDNKNIDIILKKSKIETARKEEGDYVKADHQIYSNLSKVGPHYPIQYSGEYVIPIVLNIKPAQPKLLQEIKGIVTSEYQNYLEREWINELRKRYSWHINYDIFENLLQNE